MSADVSIDRLLQQVLFKYYMIIDLLYYPQLYSYSQEPNCLFRCSEDHWISAITSRSAPGSTQQWVPTCPNPINFVVYLDLADSCYIGVNEPHRRTIPKSTSVETETIFMKV